MIDISKCLGEDCPLTDTCRRYQTPADDLYQSWIGAKYDKDAGKCWNYIPDRRGK